MILFAKKGMKVNVSERKLSWRRNVLAYLVCLLFGLLIAINFNMFPLPCFFFYYFVSFVVIRRGSQFLVILRDNLYYFFLFIISFFFHTFGNKGRLYGSCIPKLRWLSWICEWKKILVFTASKQVTVLSHQLNSLCPSQVLTISKHSETTLNVSTRKKNFKV